jgi:cation diffusion facilitator CzcD-associated flavoprotein CzcO
MSENDRYCIVGAGPAGLVAARALLKEGISFDLFERHSDVGGIWDPENEGSPMYDSAHFISSKWTSGFFGYPMPADYPDYPTHRQILDYIRSFARDYDLYDHISFETTVERAFPIGDGEWQVALAGGEERRYAGLICANGTTWQPNLPSYPGQDEFGGDIRHANTFHSAREFDSKRVLIVGGGNSAVDIACDAATHASQSFYSVRRGYRYIPKFIFGLPLDVFINEGGELPEGVVVPEDPSELIDVLVGDLTRLGLPAPDHAALATHPIVNSQILHHLAHGDILAKPDVERFTPTGAVFADGTEEELDLVLFATGYQWSIPYVDESLFEWKMNHPQLYLNVFHRSIDNLYVLGMIEFASAAYQRFDEMAQLVVGDIKARQDADQKARLRELKATDRPDLRGEMEYLDTPRHANYVEVHTYMEVLEDLRRQFGWPAPDDSFYEELRVAPAQVGR